MARARSIDNIVADIQDRASLGATDQFTPQVTVLEYANQSIARLYGKLVQARGHAYYQTPASIVTTGATLYALPLDFWEMQLVSVAYGGFQRTIQPFMLKEAPRWSETAPPAGLTINLRYTPAPPRLSLGSNATFDGIAGWEEWAVLDATIKCLSKEESDVSSFAAQRADIEEQIKQMAGDRDAQWADRVTDVYERRDFGFTLGVPRYRVTGPSGAVATDQIEILWGPLPGVAWWP